VSNELQNFLEIIEANAKMLKITKEIDIEMKVEECSMNAKMKKICYLSVTTKKTNKRVKIEEKSNDCKIEKIVLTMVTKDSNILKKA
jgi:hypothetical protein